MEEATSDRPAGWVPLWLAALTATLAMLESLSSLSDWAIGDPLLGPTTAVILVALVRFPGRSRLAVAGIGIVVGTLIPVALHSTPPQMAFASAASNVVGMGLAALALAGRRQPGTDMASPGVLLITVGLGPGAASLLCAAGLSLAHGTLVLDDWLNHWTSSALGNLAIVPFALLLTNPRGAERRTAFDQMRSPDVLVTAAVAATAAAVVTAADAVAPTFLLAPIVAIAAVQVGWPGILVSGLGISAAALVALIVHAAVPILGEPGPTEGDILKVQGALIVFLATAYCIAGRFADRTTDRRRGSRVLEQSPGILQATLDSIDQGLAVTDEQGGIVVWNRQFETLFQPVLGSIHFGLTRDRIVRTLAEHGAYGPGDPGIVAEERMARLRGGGLQEERIYTLPTGRTVVNRSHAVAGVGWLSTFSDETRRVQADQARSESERRLASVMDNLPGMAYRMGNDPDWPLEFASKGAEQLTGCPADDLVGGDHSFAKLIHPSDRSRVWRLIQTSLNAGGRFELRYRVRHTDGDWRWVWNRGFGVTAPDGNVTHVEGFIADITELEQARRQLAENNALLGSVLNGISEGIVAWDAAGRLRAFNQHFAEIVRLSQDVLNRTSWRDQIVRTMASHGFFGTADLAELEPRIDRMIELLSTVGPARTIERGDGRILEVERFPMADGGIIAVIGDVTAARNAQALISESEKRFRDFARAASDAFWEVNEDHRITMVETAGREEFDSLARALGRRFFEAADGRQVEWEEGVTVNDLFERRTAFRNVVYSYLNRHGERRYRMISGVPIIDTAYNFCGFRGAITDISDTREAELRVRDSEERYVAAMAGADEGLWDWRADTDEVFVSERTRDLIGDESDAAVISMASVRHRIHPDDRQSFFDRVKAHLNGETDSFEVQFRVVVPGRDTRWLQVRGRGTRRPDGYVYRMAGSVGDITESKRYQADLIQAQKLEAIGRLTGGIAHDFNNLLAAIRGFAKFLRDDLPVDTAQHNYAGRILQATERGIEFVGRILSFARPGASEITDIDVRDVVREIQDLLQTAMPATARLETAVATSRAIVPGDRGRMTQLLMNLCVNARDALKDGTGQITVSVADPAPTVLSRAARDHDGPTPTADRLVIDEDRETVVGTLGSVDAGGDFLQLTVEDTGMGMDADTLRLAFDPFFTTKGAGEGSGLGLAIVRSIVRSLGGACVIRSRPGHGTTFDFLLPRSPEEESRTTPVAAAKRSVEGREQVLVIDDEVDVGDALSIGLERLGYEVATVNDPDEAMEVFLEDPTTWDVIVSDHVMPRTRGLALIAEFKRHRADVLTILCSGYSDTVNEDVALDGGADAFFTKPVDAETVAACIRGLIDPWAE